MFGVRGFFYARFLALLSRRAFFCVLFQSWERKYTLCYGIGRGIRDLQNDFLFAKERSRNHFMEVTDMRFEDKKVEFVKVGENVNRIKLSSIYDHNCSSQEFVIVDDEMLEYLIESEMEFNANRRTKDNHVVALPEDETAAAKMGAVVKSEEEKYFAATEDEKKKVLDILSLLTPCQRRRLYLRFKNHLTYKAVGKMEGVSGSAIKRSCELAFEKLKPHCDFLQKVTCIKWVDLL